MHAANYELQDYRGRTPLHLAAEYDRSLSAHYLLGLSPPASCDVRDFGGLMALSVMVKNMPKVVSGHTHTHTHLHYSFSTFECVVDCVCLHLSCCLHPTLVHVFVHVFLFPLSRLKWL